MSERVTDLTSSQADAPAVIATCTAQERQYRFKEFDEEIAFEVGCAIRNTFKQQYAGKPNKGIVVHIETFTGHTLFSAVVGQAPWVGPENWLWVRAKSNIVKRFGVSSLRKGREFARMGTTATDEGLLFPEYAADGGGFPIWLNNNKTGPIGVIVVSGLPHLEDHQVIIDALSTFKQYL